MSKAFHINFNLQAKLNYHDSEHETIIFNTENEKYQVWKLKTRIYTVELRLAATKN